MQFVILVKCGTELNLNLLFYGFFPAWFCGIITAEALTQFMVCEYLARNKGDFS